MLNTRQIFVEVRPATGGNQYGFRGNGTARFRQLNPMWGGHRRAFGEKFDVEFGERRAINRFEPGDFVVFRRDQRLPVEPSAFYRPAKTFRILEFVGESAGIDEKLLRHAAADHAGAADPILFRYRDARAMTCGDACSPDAAGACANDKKIIIKFQHASARLLRKHYFGSAGAGLGAGLGAGASGCIALAIFSLYFTPIAAPFCINSGVLAMNLAPAPER